MGKNTLIHYKKRLATIPPPGCGCHTALLGAANLGALAGLSAEKLFSDLRQHIPTGIRRIPDREIRDAVDKALADHGGQCLVRSPKPAPAVKDGKATLMKIISEAKIHQEIDLWEASPIRLWREP